MLIMFVVWHHDFTPESLRQIQRSAVIRILLRDLLSPVMRGIIAR
jgi:hypothetical protein